MNAEKGTTIFIYELHCMYAENCIKDGEWLPEKTKGILQF